MAAKSGSELVATWFFLGRILDASDCAGLVAAAGDSTSTLTGVATAIIWVESALGTNSAATAAVASRPRKKLSVRVRFMPCPDACCAAQKWSYFHSIHYFSTFNSKFKFLSHGKCYAPVLLLSGKR
jgi:hypothetical protein